MNKLDNKQQRALEEISQLGNFFKCPLLFIIKFIHCIPPLKPYAQHDDEPHVLHTLHELLPLLAAADETRSVSSKSKIDKSNCEISSSACCCLLSSLFIVFLL